MKKLLAVLIAAAFATGAAYAADAEKDAKKPTCRQLQEADPKTEGLLKRRRTRRCSAANRCCPGCCARRCPGC